MDNPFEPSDLFSSFNPTSVEIEADKEPKTGVEKVDNGSGTFEEKANAIFGRKKPVELPKEIIDAKPASAELLLMYAKLTEMAASRLESDIPLIDEYWEYKTKLLQLQNKGE